MTRSSRVSGLAAAAFATSLALAGCGSDTTASPSARTATSSTEQTSTQTPTTTGKATGANYTIADYILNSGIVETLVHRGDPGTPVLDLPIPPGWQDAGPDTPEVAWSAIVYADRAMADDPPTIVAIMSKLTGDVDPARIIEYAPGEIKNLPGFVDDGNGGPTTLSGFNAIQIRGSYQKYGATRAVAQKTVMIPGQDALFVLQLNAEALQDQLGPLMDAMAAIDEQTVITQ